MRALRGMEPRPFAGTAPCGKDPFSVLGSGVSSVRVPEALGGDGGGVELIGGGGEVERLLEEVGGGKEVIGGGEEVIGGGGEVGRWRG